MTAKSSKSSGKPRPGYDIAWLLGQPPLQSYLDYVEDMTVGGATASRSQLVSEWRKANDSYGELEAAASADEVTPEIFELHAKMRPLAAKIKADPRYRRSFDAVPSRFAMVELRKLIVGQPHVDLDHAERLKARLGAAKSPEALFRFCQPVDRDEAPVQMRRTGSRRYMFWSQSSDFRFLDSTLLDPRNLQGHDADGICNGLLALTVGYGSNFLSVIQSDNRLLLHNGHHRAYALADLGITHAPCLIRTVTRLDELKLIAGKSVVEDPAFYFRAARPPLLKDFFDRKLRKVLRAARSTQVIEVSFEVKDYEIRDFGSLD